MLNLTSSLYLGLVHPSSRLPAWSSLTLGVPVALDEPPAAEETAQRVARLVRAPAARLATSTLHAFVDLAAALSQMYRQASVAVDVAAYPIGVLGLRSGLCGPGGRFHRTAHYDVQAARRWAAREQRAGHFPVLLVDGWCAGCGRVAPVAALSGALREEGGLLVVDDTQAVGLLGKQHRDKQHRDADPWGHGGGGSAVWSGSPDGVVIVASLAKAFGAPLAVLAGPSELIGSTWQQGPTVAHSSPPAVPVGLAARRALELNERIGDRLRQRLLGLLERLLGGLARRGVAVDSGRFPVVRVPVPSRDAAAGAVLVLARAGVRAVALGPSCRGRPALGLALNASLGDLDIDRAAAAVALAVRGAA